MYDTQKNGHSTNSLLSKIRWFGLCYLASTCIRLQKVVLLSFVTLFGTLKRCACSPQLFDSKTADTEVHPNLAHPRSALYSCKFLLGWMWTCVAWEYVSMNCFVIKGYDEGLHWVTVWIPCISFPSRMWLFGSRRHGSNEVPLTSVV